MEKRMGMLVLIGVVVCLISFSFVSGATGVRYGFEGEGIIIEKVVNHSFEEGFERAKQESVEDSNLSSILLILGIIIGVIILVIIYFRIRKKKLNLNKIQ